MGLNYAKMKRLQRLSRNRHRHGLSEEEEAEYRLILRDARRLIRLCDDLSCDPTVSSVIKMRYIDGLDWRTLCQKIGMISVDSARKASSRFICRYAEEIK